MIDRAIMTDRVRQQVLDYLLGALDDSEMEAVKARLESDPVYRQAMRSGSRRNGPAAAVVTARGCPAAGAGRADLRIPLRSGPTAACRLSAAIDDSPARHAAFRQPLELGRRGRGRRDLPDRGAPGPSGHQRCALPGPGDCLPGQPAAGGPGADGVQPQESRRVSRRSRRGQPGGGRDLRCRS